MNRTWSILLIVVVLVAVLFILPSNRQGVETEIIQQEGSEQFVIPNQGGNFEGHTPRGFSGMGTGLFVGDNLNPGFPDGDGVQAFLTFDISELQENSFDSVALTSDNVHVQGTPFADLGNLIVESITYDTFSRDLWDTETHGQACVLATSESESVLCEVGEVVRAAVQSGDAYVQFRIRFEKAGDGDGNQDMVFFYKNNANTNEPGTFTLQINRNEVETIHIPIVAYQVKDSAEASTGRDQGNIQEVFMRTQTIWDQAHIVLDVTFSEVILDESTLNAFAQGNFRALYALIPSQDTRLHIFYVSDLFGPNGIALAPQVALVADRTSVDDFRVTAHEIGHLLGLGHTTESRSRMMFPGANGRNLIQEEIIIIREQATAITTEN